MKTALIEIHASLVIWAFGDGSPMNTGTSVSHTLIIGYFVWLNF
jgi:hypothetical protein